MIRLDLGCRTRRRDVIGIDSSVVPGLSIRADLDVGLPFKDNSVDEVYAYHVLEHAQDLVATMEEIWRVCKEGSLVFIRVPHASSSYVTWVDPSHRRGLTIETFAPTRRAPPSAMAPRTRAPRTAMGMASPTTLTAVTTS